VRNAVEFLDLVCKETRSPNEDDASLNFDGTTIWSGPIRSGTTAAIETIRVRRDSPGVLRLWQTDAPNRTIACLGRETVEQDAAEPGTLTAHFTRDGADYTLSYRLLQVPD
jgi:hypothetical protein